MAAKKKKKELALSWQTALAENAKEGKSPKEKALTGDWISLKGSKFSLGGIKLGLELDCVVVAWNFEKLYYDLPYDEDNITSPACAALSYNEDELVPSENAANQQCDNCVDCSMNEWESSENGKGKACSDRRRLALVVAGKDDKMELKGLSIPPTSLKNWKAYINELEMLGIHPMQAAVNISFDEDFTGSGMPPLVFEFVKEITSDKALNLTASMLEPASKLIETEHDFSNYGKSSKKGKGKKKTAKKKAKKKRSKFS